MKMTEEKVSKKEVNKKEKNIINLKTLFLLLLIFAIAIIFIYPNTRNKIINAISGNLENVNEEETKLVGEDIYVSSAEFTSIVDGTESFDADDEPGNDSSPSNNVVRSFDRITYNVDLTMAIKPGQTSTEKGGKIVIEATLPSSLATLVKWDLEQMTWLDGTVSEDGTTLTGSYTLDENTSATSGRQNLQLVLQVYGAGNGTEIQPTFKFSLDGNNEEDKYILTPNIITVSAVGKYNVKLVYDKTAKKATVDYGEGEKSGRAYGYGFAIELYNDNKEKGLKGLEYPEGDITFDFDLKLERTKENSDEREDITKNNTPILWNFIKNEITYSLEGGEIDGRDMIMNTNIGLIPMGINNGDRSYTVYDSGDVQIVQIENKLNVTVKDYKFDGEFPYYSQSYKQNNNRQRRADDNEGIFTTIYFEIFVPDTKETEYKDREYYLTIENNNLKINSIGGNVIEEQQVENDDKIELRHYVNSKGYKSFFLDFKANKPNNVMLQNSGRSGDAAFIKNNVFSVRLSNSISNDTDPEYLINNEDIIFKFDGSGIEPEGEKISFRNAENIQFKAYYLTKKDGTNWTSQEEMNKTVNIDDFNVYKNKSDIPENYICVGILFESIDGGISKKNYEIIEVDMKIKEDAILNRTYAMTYAVKAWTQEQSIDRNIYNVENKEITGKDYPEAAWKKEGMDYTKIEYNDDASQIIGSTDYYPGISLLAVGSYLHSEIRTVDNIGSDKAEYDLSKNENVVTYSVVPKLDKNENLEEQINNVTLKNMVTMPSGLEYVPGSSKRGEESYNEPEIIENEDGTTTLAWYIYGVTSGDEITPITFDARIDQSTPNETRLNIKYVVLEEIGENEEAKIGNSYIDFRTSETEVIVINLGSHKVYQEAVTPVIENNGEITYKITYQNKSSVDTPDFQVLDILPYNGDGRGTSFNGTYTLKNVKVTGDTSNLELFTTTKLEAREISPKDEGIGVSDIWENKEIGTDINEPATVI